MTTLQKIQKVTSKGQITLPVSWRRKMKTDHVLVRAKNDKLEISEARLANEPAEKEYTVFDAIRDNKGKGLKATDLVKILKKIGH